MKISAVKFTDNKIHFRQKTTNENNDDKYIYEYEYAKNRPDFKKTAAYSASIIAAGLGVIYIARNMNVTKYARTLAKSLEAHASIKASPHSLASVMGGDELLRLLPTMKNKNYDVSNLSNGVFRIDLHSHTAYSDGKGLVKNLLDDAADYADKLNEKTKQKFIFAFTDQDSLDSVKAALEIIAENPDRYKNLRFVPAVGVSFAHKATKSGNPCEMSELLVYGINPYSKKINNFITNIKNKRILMTNNFIEDARNIYPEANFSFREFQRFYDFEHFGNVANIHWRVNHYIQTKQAITQLAKSSGENPDKLYLRIMKENIGASLGQLHDAKKVPGNIGENPKFEEIFKKYAPHFENDKIVASSENTFEEIIEAFKDENNIFMAFAHPAYLTDYVENPAEFLKYLTEHSNGLIKASESFHQSYPDHLKEKAGEIQAITQNLKLLDIGGVGNYEFKLFN